MTPDTLPPPDLEDHEHELWGQNVRADFFRADTVRRLIAEAVAPLRARILELEAVHEDASGQILEAVAQERERIDNLLLKHARLNLDTLEYLEKPWSKSMSIDVTRGPTK